MLQMHTDTVLIPCKIPQFPRVMFLPVPSSLDSQHQNTTVWLQVMRWLASTIRNAHGTVAEVDNEVDLEEDDASGVPS